MESKNSKEAPQGHNFGTFGGVFTPSILTIFGLVMFMLTGTVVGHAGIYWSLAILLIAQTITLSTGLSISSISTNTPIKGGGAYFLISRALGPGFGSAIGVTLFCAQALSVPFYILGFTGALTSNFKMFAPYYLQIALVTGLLLFIVTWVGAGVAVKCQYFIFVILCLAIIAFLGGAAKLFSWETFSDNALQMASTSSEGVKVKKISEVFAIFFPAVTGIMAGVNMSGDLKNPAKSIPRGTLAAIIVATIVYGLQMVLLGGAFTRQDLINKPYLSLVENALYGAGFIVISGVIAATISSAIGSYMGAPRVLQALARDKIIKVLNPFSKGYGAHNEPRRALILTFIITMAVLFWGGAKGLESLGVVASVITMFFLYTYGMVNLAAFVESYGGNPSFRPRFKYFHWGTALFGACSCIIVSFLIDTGASITALVIIALLFISTRRKEMKRTFGDATRGFVYTRIRNNLLRLAKMPPDPKNWRPTIAVLTGNPHTRYSLLEYACLFECERGILSLVEIIVGENEDIGTKRGEIVARLKDFAEDNDLDIFPEVIVTKDFDEGLKVFLQAHSLGPVKPNIVMMGWPKDTKRVKPFTAHLETILDLKMSCVLFINPRNTICPKFARGTVDLWWRGMENGSLMVILAYLLCSNSNWDRTSIRILRITQDENSRDEALESVKQLADAARINVEIKIVVSREPFNDLLRQYSWDAVAIFLGFIPPSQKHAESFFIEMNKRLEDLPPTFLIASSGEADLLA